MNDGVVMTDADYRVVVANPSAKHIIKAQEKKEAAQKSMGIKDKPKTEYRTEIPDYNTGPRMTSDKVAGNGAKREGNKYTGTLIKGIATRRVTNNELIYQKFIFFKIVIINIREFFFAFNKYFYYINMIFNKMSCTISTLYFFF
mgnify:CR=1 FL=1